MKPPPFDYIKVESSDEAVDLLAEYGNDAKIIAGGQSLMPMLNMRLVRPQILIDISMVAELNEISRNVDGYRISTFMNKDKGGKLNMGPIWDFNIAFGNANYCGGELTSGWAFNFNEVCPQDGMHVPFWWKRLLEDPEYVSELKEKWSFLRANEFSNESMINTIDNLKLELEKSDATTRNFGKWLILGKYIWPNNFIGNKYSEEIDYLKDWIEKRLSWMDNEINDL